MSQNSNLTRNLFAALVVVLILLGLVTIFWPQPKKTQEIAPVVRVVDTTGILSFTEKQHISRYHALLSSEYDIDYRVIISDQNADINTYANHQFNALGVGKLSHSQQGLLLVIFPAQNSVRLEVGYAMEGTFVDAFVAYIERRQMVPFFRKNRISDGILATTELIVTRAQNAKKGQDVSQAFWMLGSGGAGAVSKAHIAEDTEKSIVRSEYPTPGEDDRPEEILRRYIQAMLQHNSASDLPLYTPKTQAMLANWVVTRAQMDNVVKNSRKCKPKATQYHMKGHLAVIRYPVEERHCSPWFFEKRKIWQLDLTMMQKLIRFNYKNQWHFAPKTYNRYGFAFADWYQDKQGYAHQMDWRKARWGVSYRTERWDGNTITYISYVAPSSAAEAFGFKQNDIVKRFDAKKIARHADMHQALKMATGDVEVDIIRNGQALTLTGVAP